jgi:hypothetical protein
LPYFVYRDGKLILDDSLLAARNRSFTFRLRRSFIGKAFSWTKAHLRLLQLIDAARVAYSQTSEVQLQKAGNQEQPLEPGLDNDTFREPATSAWNDAWRVTEQLILRMRDEVGGKGAKFLVVTGSMGIQVHPNASAREYFMNRLGSRNLFYPDYRIKALGERERLQVLTLAPPFQDYAARHNVFLHGAGETQGTGHWNELGHRLAGELIGQELCKLVMQENSLRAVNMNP